MIPDSYRAAFAQIAEQRFTEPGIYRVRVSDHIGASSAHTAAQVPLDLAAGIEGMWPHDTNPEDAIVEIVWLETIPGR